MDKSSGRDSTNSGSDSAVHHKGTASQQYGGTTKTGSATPVTGKQSNGYVGNGKPGKPDERSDVK